MSVLAWVVDVVWAMRKASRSRAIVVTGVVLVTIVAARHTVVAQSGRYKSGVDLVPLTVTVTDGAGRYVPNLTAADFAVFEEGRPQVVSQFAAGHVPLDVGFLIDTSSSMRANLLLAQKAARGLVHQLRDGDRGAVTGITSTVLLHQLMTPDLARVDAALRSTRAEGNTALYEALYIALRQYQQDRMDATEVRRGVIVLLSDGVDTSSHVTFEDVLDQVRRVDVTIYVVSLTDDPSLAKAVVADRGSFESAHALSRFASESGGRLFTPRTARELPQIYEAIGQELSSQYVLGYVPAGWGGDALFRRVSVGVLQPRAGMARTRAGYYADRTRAAAGLSSSTGWSAR